MLDFILTQRITETAVSWTQNEDPGETQDQREILPQGLADERRLAHNRPG